MESMSRRLDLLKRVAAHALEINDFEAAWMPLSEILSINPDDAHGLYMTGCFFRMKGHPGVALQMFRRCASLQPGQLNAWLFYGASLHDVHRYDEAIEVFKMCAGMAPTKPAPYANLAASHVQKGEFREAYNQAHEALKRDPKHENARICLGMASLGLRRWQEGFDNYRYLFGNQVPIRHYGREQPEWDGTPGQTVVVQGDQGLGDELRYACMLGQLSDTCKKVVYECHPKLVNVLKRSFPNIDFYGSKKAKVADWVNNYAIDARIHASAMGKFFRTKDSDFVFQKYMKPDSDLSLRWRSLLDKYPKPWVGIAWQGGIVQTQRDERSIKPEQYLPLIEQGGTFIDLSYHDSAAEVSKLAGRIKYFDVGQADYDDTMALVSCLDLVVTVPTAVMHAAGSMQIPAWVLVHKFSHWEFGTQEHSMPWYSSEKMRLFRVKDDVSASIEMMAKAYGEWLDAKNFHRNRPETAAGLHGSAKFDSAQSVEASLDNAIIIANAPNKKARANGLYF